VRGQIFENRRVQATGGRPVISAEPSIPSWVVTTLIGAGGFAIAMTAMFIFFDPAGNAPREDPVTSSLTQPPANSSTPASAAIENEKSAAKRREELGRQVRVSGERAIASPCNEDFRQAFIKDAKAWIEFLAVQYRSTSLMTFFGADTGQAANTATEVDTYANRMIMGFIDATHVTPEEIYGGETTTAMKKATSNMPANPVQGKLQEKTDGRSIVKASESRLCRSKR
jgi:hypothetical protein